ncbi:hypothetical protein U1Q18_022793 [Sarracenia purpurea var. burkii]
MQRPCFCAFQSESLPVITGFSPFYSFRREKFEGCGKALFVNPPGCAVFDGITRQIFMTSQVRKESPMVQVRQTTTESVLSNYFGRVSYEWILVLKLIECPCVMLEMNDGATNPVIHGKEGGTRELNLSA